MKVAVVHDYLNTKGGGAERVLRDVLALYPNADIFTLIYNPDKFSQLTAGRQVKTSSLQRAPRFLKQRPQFLLPFIRRAVSRLDLTGYDLIISSSGAWCKNITVPTGARHICYCHSPARMLWVDWPAYIDSFHFWGFRVIPFSRLWLVRLCSRLRLWDYYQTAGVDQLVANSRYVAGRIAKFYHRDSEVVYPGIELEPLLAADRQPEDFYLVISTLARYKNIDVIIRAVRQHGGRLVIAGDGSDRDRLQALAKKSGGIEFRGYVGEQEKIDLLRRARALVVANVEDFGITPAEALAAGTPVVALAGGGIAETVRDGKHGVLFDKPAVSELVRALQRFEKLRFEPVKLRAAARRYSLDQFRTRFAAVINMRHGKA